MNVRNYILLAIVILTLLYSTWYLLSPAKKFFIPFSVIDQGDIEFRRNLNIYSQKIDKGEDGSDMAPLLCPHAIDTVRKEELGLKFHADIDFFKELQNGLCKDYKDISE